MLSHGFLGIGPRGELGLFLLEARDCGQLDKFQPDAELEFDESGRGTGVLMRFFHGPGKGITGGGGGATIAGGGGGA